jgi:hypothetical protein
MGRRQQAPVAVAILLVSMPAANAAQNGAEALLGGLKPIVDVRLRYENVDQEPLAKEADAVTLRARLGFETPQVMHTTLLVEGEFLWPLNTDYRGDPLVPSNAQYPVVADSENYELNRLQFTNTALPQTTVSLGRQRINLDDQRFVGNVGWRQNEQTFDALRVVNKSIKDLTFDVTYLNQVNRVFGKDSVQGRYEGDTVLANVSYQLPIGKLTGFGYWIDIDNIDGVPVAKRDASQTLGLRFTGEQRVGKTQLAYVLSYATQEDYKANPIDFDVGYYLVELTGSYAQFSLGVGYEVLEGDGVKGFTTPLATLHKFQGWADKFLATPPNGIEDLYVNVGAAFKAVGPLDSLALLLSYHSYEAEHVDVDYGSEINLQLTAKRKRFTAMIKYADYDADELFTDTSKYWLVVEYAW